MILYVFAVHDKTLGAYLPPFMARAKGEALRSFGEAVNDPAKSFGRYSLDYSLCLLGEFDDNSGCYKCHDPVRIIGANEVLTADDIVVPSK